MKYKIIFYSLLFPLFIASCSSLKQISNRNVDEKILGRWDIQSISSSAKPDSILIKDFNRMLRTLLVNAFIEFTADHKFNAQIAGKAYEGSWAMDSKSQKLKITEKNKEVIYSLSQAKETEIDLSSREANQDFIVKLHKVHH